MKEYLAFVNYSGWGKSIQIGADFIYIMQHKYYIVILRWPVGSRMLHQNTTVIRRVTTVRLERGVRLTVCQGDVS